MRNTEDFFQKITYKIHIRLKRENVTKNNIQILFLY